MSEPSSPTESTEPRDERRPPRWRAFAKLILLGLLVGGAILVAHGVGERYLDPAVLAAVLRDIRDMPGIHLFFILGFGAATAVGFPATALTLAGGAIFNFGWGFAVNWVGAMLGATIAFGLARWLGRDATRHLLGRRFARLDALSAEHGFWAVVRLRLVPVVPFLALNFGSAVSGVRVRDYLPATALGLVPFIGVYTYFADVLVDGVAEARQEAVWHVAVAAGMLLALSFVPRLLGLGRRR